MLSPLYLGISSLALSLPLSLVCDHGDQFKSFFSSLKFLLCKFWFWCNLAIFEFSWRMYQHHVGSTAVSGNSCSCTVVSSIAFVAPWSCRQLWKSLKKKKKWFKVSKFVCAVRPNLKLLKELHLIGKLQGLHMEKPDIHWCWHTYSFPPCCRSNALLKQGISVFHKYFFLYRFVIVLWV